MKKIGIMGGTFNPIHNGHVEIAKAAYEQYELDEVWFMPNHIPAYKSSDNIVSGKQRLEMINEAIADYPYFIVSDFEINRDGKTYTYETFELLSMKYSEYSFYFIMGADSLFYFEKWVHPEIILKYASILVAARDDSGIEKINDKITEFMDIYKYSNFQVVECKSINCSSSKIREYLAECDDLFKTNKNFFEKPLKRYTESEGENKFLREKERYIEKYLSPKVLSYIQRNHLYNYN